VPGLNKSEKREFRTRQRARHIGGQEDAFEDWEQGQLVDGMTSIRVGGGGGGRGRGAEGGRQGRW
jgi:hypothetical protein